MADKDIDVLAYDYGEQFADIQKQQDSEYKDLLAAYAEVFGTKAGKKVLKHIYDKAGINSPTVYAKGAEVYKNAAIHDFVILHFVQMLFIADKNVYLDLIKEQIDDVNKQKQE